MESMGDFYAIALHDPQLRAGLVAPRRENRTASESGTGEAQEDAAMASGPARRLQDRVRDLQRQVQQLSARRLRSAAWPLRARMWMPWQSATRGDPRPGS